MDKLLSGSDLIFEIKLLNYSNKKPFLIPMFIVYPTTNMIVYAILIFICAPYSVEYFHPTGGQRILILKSGGYRNSSFKPTNLFSTLILLIFYFAIYK